MTFIDLFFCWLLAMSPAHPVEANSSGASTQNTSEAPAAKTRTAASSAGSVVVVNQSPRRISNGF